MLVLLYRSIDSTEASIDASIAKMLNEITLERRLATLEQTVCDLQRKVDSKPVTESWLQKLAGSISDEAVFVEALEYGKAFRQSDRPIDESAN
jgi:hypothetical protein